MARGWKSSPMKTSGVHNLGRGIQSCSIKSRQVGAGDSWCVRARKNSLRVLFLWRSRKSANTSDQIRKLDEKKKEDEIADP